MADPVYDKDLEEIVWDVLKDLQDSWLVMT